MSGSGRGSSIKFIALVVAIALGSASSAVASDSATKGLFHKASAHPSAALVHTGPVTGGSPSPAPPSLPPPAPLDCDPRLLAFEASDPLHAVGDRVIDRHGVRYVPYGIVVMGLQQWNALTPWVEKAIDAQIQAATSSFWRVNTLRLQVASGLEERDPKRFFEALDGEVNAITCKGDFVVINDNTLFTTNNPAPTEQDLEFNELVAERYKDRPNVILDPFNEPRLDSPRGPSHTRPVWMWRMWRYGGVVNGKRYLGMQALIDGIRSQGNNNLIWIEYPHWGNRTALWWRYPLRGRNIEREFHHPNLNHPRKWKALLEPDTLRPSVEGEESQYSSPTRKECFRSAYKNLPKLLRVLDGDHDGLMAWTLEPDVLVKSKRHYIVTDTIAPWYPANEAALTNPTKIGRHYSCKRQGIGGMGQLAMIEFHRNAARYNPYSLLHRR